MGAAARADSSGNCYGTGQTGIDLQEQHGRITGVCPECGRRIGVVTRSSRTRLTHHKPVVTEYERKKLRRMGDPTDFARIAARLNVMAWIGEERRTYSDLKYSDDGEARHKLKIEMRNYGYIGEWEVFVTNYLTRVRLFGLDTEAGRQALGKTIVTMLHCLETAVEVHGPMPAPGVPSGEIEHWDRGE